MPGIWNRADDPMAIAHSNIEMCLSGTLLLPFCSTTYL